MSTLDPRHIQQIEHWEKAMADAINDMRVVIRQDAALDWCYKIHPRFIDTDEVLSSDQGYPTYHQAQYAAERETIRLAELEVARV